MKNLIYSLLLLSIHSAANAQSNLITLSNETNPIDGVITINAQSVATGTYTLKIKINANGFTNNYTSPFSKTITQGTSQICKLTPDKSASMRGLGYNYTYFAGSAFRKPPTNFPHYILPISNGKTTKASSTIDLSAVLNDKINNLKTGQGFYFEKGDTICAARAGQIFNINDQVKQGEGRETLYASERNQIQIQHGDGTIAYYTMLAPIKCLVENGNRVIPGQPIAVFNSTSTRYTLLLSINYLDESKLNTDYPKDVYTPLPLYFYLNENSQSTQLIDGQKYEATRSLNIITEELSKREKKRLETGGN
jgi:hypothetical protein